MVDPLSITTGVVTFVTFAFQSSALLHSTIRSFKSQNKDIRALRDELGDLTSVLESLLGTITAHPSINFDTLKLPLQRCGTTCEEYNELIARCSKHSDGSRPSIRDWVTQKYLQGDITDFRTMLASYKSTINIALANANIRVAAITPGVLEEYKDLIADTQNDLQSHLDRLDEQEQGLNNEQLGSASPGSEVTELHAMLEEKESTRLGLQICAQLSAQITELESTSTEVPQFSDRPSAHKYLKSGLNTTKGSIETVVNRLRSHETDVERQLESMSSLSPSASDQTTAQLDTLQEAKASIRQCINVVTEASEHLAEERRNIFEDITMADNSYEYSVSTIGDLVTARKLDLKGRSRHVAGQISSQDFQKSIEALTRLDMEHIRATHPPVKDQSQSSQGSEPEPPGPATGPFHNRYGPGLSLSPPSGQQGSRLSSRTQE